MQQHLRAIPINLKSPSFDLAAMTGFRPADLIEASGHPPHPKAGWMAAPKIATQSPCSAGSVHGWMHQSLDESSHSAWLDDRLGQAETAVECLRHFVGLTARTARAAQTPVTPTERADFPIQLSTAKLSTKFHFAT
jgi:hypothetical protein